jgi:Tol biopolymer transport system component
VDAATGTAVISNLEQLQVWSNGSPLKAPDFNFWGVTFAANSTHFYATLGTNGRTYLVQGDIGSGRVTTVKEGIECPSLSPDNTRVAFKKRVDGTGSPKWRLYVLDLASLVESPVAETRFIDEQVEWLDNGHILYAQTDPLGKSPVVSDVWMVAADGSGQPSLFLANASTPIVLRR